MMPESSSPTSWLLSAAYTSTALCAGALLLLYVYQEKLLYFPTIPGTAKFTKDNPPGTQRWSAIVCHLLWY